MKVNKFKEDVELTGYISDMPDSYYHKTPGFVSKSSLSVLKESPFKFFNQKQRNPTKAMQMGTALHCAALEPEKFKSEYLLMPEVTDRRTKAYKEAFADNHTKELLIGQDAKNVEGMLNAIASNEAASQLLSLDGWCELSGFHTDEETGVKLRHRFDKLTKNGYAIDVKKTQSVHPDELSKTIYKYGYQMQDALYSDAYEAITGEKLKQFYFIFVEESYPHEVAVVYLDDISKQVGRDMYQQLLIDLVYYRANPDKANNNKPVEMVSLPEWALRQYEDELEDGGIF